MSEFLNFRGFPFSGFVACRGRKLIILNFLINSFSSILRARTAWLKTVILTLSALLFSNTVFAKDVNQMLSEMGIEDITAMKKIVLAGDVLTDGSKAYICVKIGGTRYAIWQPDEDKLSHKTSDVRKSCARRANFPPNLRPTGVHFDKITPCSEFSKTCDQVVADIGELHEDRSNSSNCGTNFAAWYEINWLNGKSFRFYVIERQRQPDFFLYFLIPARFRKMRVNRLNSIGSSSKARWSHT